MTAYMLFVREEPPADGDAMAEYGAMNRAAGRGFREAYGLEPLAVYPAVEAVEGEAPDGLVLLAFPSAADARAWYASPEYQAALPSRLRGATYRALLFDGLDVPPQEPA